MQVFLALIFILCTLILLYFKYLEGYWRRRGIPHIEPQFPFGNIKEWRRSKHLVQLLQPVYERFKGSGPFAGFYFLLRPVVVATDLDLIKQVMIKDFSNFDSRGVFHNERDDPLTANLFALEGEKWRALRNKLSSSFTSGKMKTMFPTVKSVGEELSHVVADKITSTPTGILEVTDLVGRYTADVIGSCAFGLDCDSLHNPNAEFVTMGRRLFVERNHNKLVDSFIESFPALAAKLRMRQTHKDVHNFYTRIVRETIELREQSPVQRNDFLKMLLDIKNGTDNSKSRGNKQFDNLTFNEIVAQCFIFLVAGFETSSTTMGFALRELAYQPEVQERLRNEINEVLAQHNNELTYESLAEMTYMQQVITETLRKYPILPHLVRKANNRYETGDPKYYIEKDTTVVIPVHAIHYDPEIYPNPEAFDPDRFTEEAEKARHSMAYLAFGEGPRNCIGMRFGKMQAYIGLVYLIRNFIFSPCVQTKPLVFVPENILLNAEGGIRLKVEKVT